MENYDKPIEEMDDEEFNEWVNKVIKNMEAISNFSMRDFFKPWN